MQFLQQLLHPKCFRLSIINVVISVLFLCALPPVANAAAVNDPTGKLSLNQALDLALNASPELAMALHEQEAFEGAKLQAGVRPNPSISTSIQDTRSATRQTTLQLSQEIELGNKRGARINAADAFVSKAKAELALKKAEVHANVIAAFYEVLAAQARVDLAKSSLKVANLALGAAAKRVKAGKSSPVEETKSKIAESTAKIALFQANSQLVSSRKQLSSLWGDSSPQFESAEGEVTIIPEIDGLGDLGSISEMIQNSPVIKVAKIEVETRENITKLEQSKTTPNITISAGIVNNQELGLNQALLGLSVPIPLFDRNQGGVQEALSRKYKAQDALLALENRLSADFANQYERLNTARQAATSLSTEILPSAQSAFDAANKGFSAGKFNFLDVLDAQRTLFQSKSQYIQALLEAHQAVAEIERILGDVFKHSTLSNVATHQEY